MRSGAEARGKAAMDDHHHKESRKKQKMEDNGGGGKSREQDGKSFDEFVKTLKKNVSEDEVRMILSENGQELDSATAVYEHCADQMMYGPLEDCPSCGSALKFAVHEYSCTGYISEWSKCSFSSKDVPRRKEPLKIPKQLKNEFVHKWEKDHDAEKRPVRESEKAGAGDDSADGKPFSSVQVVLAGRTRQPQYKMREGLEKLGGKVVHVLKEGVTCLVVGESNITSGVHAKMGDARSMNIPVVKASWLQDCLSKEEVLDFGPYLMDGQGRDDKQRGDAEARPRQPASETEVTTLYHEEMKVWGKRAVHKDSELDKEGGCIFENEDIIYNCAFSICDQTTGLNHCATEQLVKLPDGTLYLYHKRGRLSTGVPLNQRLDQQSNVSNAIDQFVNLFEDLTGNDFEAWERQKKFTKKRSKFYPLDLDPDSVDPRAGGLQDQQLGISSAHTKLDPKVARFCRCIFSQSVYRHAMFEMGIDSPELPTGCLSEVHIERCKESLLEFASFLKKGERDTRKHERTCLDMSNKFFSLLPSSHPTVFNDLIHLTELGASVLEAVRDISVAAKIIGDLTKDDVDDPLANRFEKLNSSMSPVDKESDDYKMVQKYLEKTYEPVKYENVTVGVTMEDLFVVDSRAGPTLDEITKVNNRVLLWCGTRTSNLVRCLSKGMLPAIVEAPVPGYMFGKGLCCTDTAGKAADYAFTGVGRPEGFLMLAIVGLGDKVLELAKPTEDVTKYENEKVGIKALGKRGPDPSEHFKWKHDVTVPCGELKPTGAKDASLEFNEYVVYDPKQVKLQFIVQVRYEEIET